MNNIKILFVLDKSKINAKGIAPLRCRLTFQSKRKIFSMGIFINPMHWNAKKQKAFPSNIENDQINTQLSLIKQQINQAFLLLQIQGISFDVEDIYFNYTGESNKEEKTIIKLFEEHNERMKKLVGIDYSEGTLRKFEQSLTALKDYLKFKFNRRDYNFQKLDLQFVEDFEFYLKTQKSFAVATTNKTIQRFRKIVKNAISQAIIDRDPFVNYKVKHVKKKIIYLSAEELTLLENYRFKAPRLQIVADMFIFCCYTGLPYKEMSNLFKNDIVLGFDSNKWIKKKREKTQNYISVPLLPKCLKIIDKYSVSDEEKVFPKISNQKFNAYLKEIADIVGIDKNLTHHLARRTFATTVLLYNDVPMEIVSELLGHSKITTTQDHYAKVVQKKVGEYMELLKNKLK